MGFDIGGTATLTAPSGTLLLNGGATSWMKVNANGVVTRPQTPFMRGHIVGGGAPYNAGGATLKITPKVQVGNCWNISTGQWTCPVAGYYMAQFGAICYQQAGYVNFYQNGVSKQFLHWNHMCTWHYVNFVSILICQPGDTLDWRLTGLTPATTGIYAEADHAMYSIALMA